MLDQSARSAQPHSKSIIASLSNFKRIYARTIKLKASYTTSRRDFIGPQAREQIPISGLKKSEKVAESSVASSCLPRENNGIIARSTRLLHAAAARESQVRHSLIHACAHRVIPVQFCHFEKKKMFSTRVEIRLRNLGGFELSIKFLWIVLYSLRLCMRNRENDRFYSYIKKCY